jgi:hypothetical protein
MGWRELTHNRPEQVQHGQHTIECTAGKGDIAAACKTEQAVVTDLDRTTPDSRHRLSDAVDGPRAIQDRRLPGHHDRRG